MSIERLIQLLPGDEENLKRQKDPAEILRVAEALSKVEGINAFSPDVWLAQVCQEYDSAQLNSRGLRMALDAAIEIQNGK